MKYIEKANLVKDIEKAKLVKDIERDKLVCHKKILKATGQWGLLTVGRRKATRKPL